MHGLTPIAPWIHPTPRGTYLAASCLYAAITGFSPVGLAHPGVPEEEAGKLQELAWAAYLEANSKTDLTSVPSAIR